MSEEKRKKDTGIFSLSSDGKITVKSSAIVVFIGMLLTGGLTGGTFYGMQAAAPDPQVVEKTATDVGEIKTELARLNVLLSALADTRSQDKQEIQRQFDEQRRRIDALQEATVSQRQLDDLQRRVAELERKVK